MRRRVSGASKLASAAGQAASPIARADAHKQAFSPVAHVSLAEHVSQPGHASPAERAGTRAAHRPAAPDFAILYLARIRVYPK